MKSFGARQKMTAVFGLRPYIEFLYKVYSIYWNSVDVLKSRHRKLIHSIDVLYRVTLKVEDQEFHQTIKILIHSNFSYKSAKII